MTTYKDVHYSDYLQLDKILNAQEPESSKHGQEAHDEMLFIIIHQSYEIWFKQILHEIDSIGAIMSEPRLNDNSPELQTVVHRLKRIVVILRMMVQKIDILETMTPMDFLDFRNMLRPASGFQSWQFKITEARLGLKFDQRYAQQYYISQLRPEHVEMIKRTEETPTLLELVNKWLERIPFFKKHEYWDNYQASYEAHENVHRFWSDYRGLYMDSLVEGEKENIKAFDNVFLGDNPETSFSADANKAALFIMLYRGYPLLQQPFQLLNTLLEIDELLSLWRFRHLNMVHRMIGTRIGTGGSSGKEYLKGAMEKHYIYKDLAALSSFLIERRRLPLLSNELVQRLGFAL